MSTTPNMGMILPTDHASGDVWGSLVNAAFGVTDLHNHTTGQGVKVPPGGLNMNANLSFSPAGAPNAITDLLAIDFTAVAAAAVTGFSGALFLNSADSELYWRNTTGTNVKITNGASLNFAAIGGIGGDYSAVSALESFDDASDSYWFQQQVGAGVRQYARMRSADLDLYEFKANPAGGVPTNRVRLASPAALAASYALTLPGALPASGRVLAVDISGQISAAPSSLTTVTSPMYISATGTVTAGTTVTINIPVLQQGTSPIASLVTAVTTNLAAGTSTANGVLWIANPIPVGASITALRAKLSDVGGASVNIRLKSKTMSSLSAPTWADQGTSATSAGSGAIQQLTVTGINFQVPAMTEIGMWLFSAVGGSGFVIYIIEMDYAWL